MHDRPSTRPEGAGDPSDPYASLIRAAFEGRELSVPQQPVSVVATLHELTGAEPSVELGHAARDAREAASAPRLLETRPAREGRYVISGEIGRGGIGVVYRGRDTDLGRDVALKMMRSRHARDPVLVTSFLEEAQVGAQLQHPGIVPVYEMGLSRKGQPYFAMKLVEGETLACLLEKRAHPGEDQVRLLGIFAQVCQAVAYAHAQGVVHRDLKPANIMIGPFGEVQVVDWGLAKVLRDGDRAAAFGAQAGLVLGSPGYMSPEQAQGEEQRVDERSDVFALGAILCDVLTGTPPVEDFERDDPGDLTHEERLAGLHRRLDSSSADKELTRLARSCLARDPAGRPRDAGEVSQRMEAYFAAVEERAEAARVRAAKAEIVARGERRTRRLVLALAASVLATAAVVVGAYLRAESRRTDRRDRIRLAAGAELVQAEVLRERANARGVGGSPAWSEARMAVERASAHLAAEDAPRELRERATVLVAAIDREESAALERLRHEREELALLEELEESRVRQWNPVYELGASQIAADYGDLFRAHGLPFDTLAPSEAVARLSESGRRAELAANVMNWSMARRALDPPDLEGAEHLLAVALALDDEPFRTSVYGAIRRGDAAALAELAGRLDPVQVPPATVALLMHGLIASFRIDEGIDILRGVQRRKPGDFLVNATLGTLLYSEGSMDEALGFLRAGLATRPHSKEVLLLIGDTLLALGELDEADSILRSLLESEPDFALAHAALGKLHRRRGHPDRAVVVYRRALGIAPEFSVIHHGLGVALWQLGNFQEALAALREATRLDASNAQHWDKLGELAREAGLGEEALEAYRSAAELEPDSSVRHNNLGTAQLDLGRVDQAVASYRTALALDPTIAHTHKYLGVALQSLGDHGAASEAFREAAHIEPRNVTYQAALAASLGLLGDYSGAEGAVRAALRLEPDHFKSRVNLGQLLILGGDHAGAVVQLRRAIELEDGVAVPFGMLARLLANAPDETVRDSDAAVSFAERAVELAPAVGDWQLMLGLAYYRTERWEESRDALVRAIEFRSQEPEPELARFFMAMAEEALGEHARAVELFTTADEQTRERPVADPELERARDEAVRLLGLDPGASGD